MLTRPRIKAAVLALQWVELFERESGFAVFKAIVPTAYNAVLHESVR